MEQVTLRLHPVDVWMFRETRYFAEATSDSRSEFPPPKTIAGAMRTLMLRAAGVDLKNVRCAMRAARSAGGVSYISKLKEHLRAACEEACGASWPVDVSIVGPFLWRGGTRWYPLPRSVVKTNDGKAVALIPSSADVPGWDSTAGKRPLVAGTCDAVEGWDDAYLDETALVAFLNGMAPDASTIERGKRRHFIVDEPRVGIAIEARSGTADEGLIYSSTFMRLKPGCALDVDLRLPDAPPERLAEFIKSRPWLRLGGEGRVARVEVVEVPAEPPPAPKDDGKPLVYLATPAVFAGAAWHPAGADPLAAAVGSPQVFSGWDLAANLPMKTRYAVPAGAVFFYENDAAELPTHATSVSNNDDDKAAGWGYCFRGVWS